LEISRIFIDKSRLWAFIGAVFHFRIIVFSLGGSSTRRVAGIGDWVRD